MFSDTTKLSNVTLVPVVHTKKSHVKVCNYNQFGFCKFGDKCRMPHVSELCNDLHCDKKLCEKRHPKECKYFSTYSTCKFGKHCAFKHVESNPQSCIQELSNDLKSLTGSIKEMADKITQLELELYNMKKSDMAKTMNESNSKLKCEICKYQASSNTVLKAHMTKNHKLEKLRLVSTPDESLKLSPPPSFQQDSPQYDSDATLSPSSPFFSPLPPPTSPSTKATSPTLVPVKTSSTPSKDGQCAFPGCFKTSKNFFKKTKLDVSTVKYNGTKKISSHFNTFVCDHCLKFVPLQEMRLNPPVIL